jgi:hypothetical protein
MCLQICIMLCADHGPCVSGAHNSIVTARAGKDLVSSLVSGELLFDFCMQNFYHLGRCCMNHQYLWLKH